MSITKLISQGKAYDELFTTATYIQTDDGVGIYPTYENALRNVVSFTNVVSQDLPNGMITINTTSLCQFEISQTYLKNNRSYTIYYESSSILNTIKGREGITPFNNRFLETPTSKSGIINFSVTDTYNTIFQILVNPLDYSKNIKVKFTVVPYLYPYQQEWIGSLLNNTLLQTIKSFSFQLKDFYCNDTVQDMFIFRSTLNTLRIRVIARTLGSDFYLAIYKNNTGGDLELLQSIDNSELITISLDTNILSVYQGTKLFNNFVVSWIEPISTIKQSTSFGVSGTSYNIRSFFMDTSISEGYIQGTEPVIIPTCKLGLAGSEIDLPKESRMQSTVNRVVKKLESESANATPHTQYIATKDIYEVNYDIISDANLKMIKAIEALQWENNTRLSYIYNEESGNLITKTVRAEVKTGGNRMLRDRYFNSGLSIELKE